MKYKTDPAISYGLEGASPSLSRLSECASRAAA
jgi:hypothetical protein